MTRKLLAALAFFDLVLSLASMLWPESIAGLLWKEAGTGGLVMIRRTGALWLFFAAAEIAAWLRPSSAERLRLVACLRWMDVPADAIWVAMAQGITPFGYFAIGAAPILNAALGIVLWRAASKAEKILAPDTQTVH